MRTGIISNSGTYYKPRPRAVFGKVENTFFVCGGFVYSNQCFSSDWHGGEFINYVHIHQRIIKNLLIASLSNWTVYQDTMNKARDDGISIALNSSHWFVAGGAKQVSTYAPSIEIFSLVNMIMLIEFPI